jgi:hypothetical protein
MTPLTWSEVAADRPRGVMEAVDCPTTTQCVAVDDYGDALVERAGVWSRPVVVAPASFVGLSCPTTTFCAAIGLNFVTTFNGKTWSVPKVIDATPVPSLWSVTCPTATFCKVVNAHGYVFTYNGLTWSAPVLVENKQTDSISCPATTMCMVTDNLGGITRWDGHTWQPATTVLDAETVGLADELVDCPTTTFCEATSPDSTATWNGTSWSARAVLVTYPELLDNLSCSAANACHLLDLENNIWTTTNGRSWVKGPNDGFVPSTPNLSPVRGLSCPSAGLCTAVGTVDLTWPGQDAKTFNGTAWSATKIADPYDDGWLIYVSCASISFCAAVDRYGYAIMKNGSTWSYPQQIAPEPEGALRRQMYGVACPVVGWCIAVDSAGYSYTFNGSTWSAPVLVGQKPGALSWLHCASRTLCTAQRTNTQAFTYNGTSWKSGPKLPTGGGAPLICTSPTFCVIFDGDGPYGAATWNGTTWSPNMSLGSLAPTNVTACASRTDCTVSDNLSAAHWNGKSWSAPHKLPTVIQESISCVGGGVCIAATVHGVVQLTNGVEGKEMLIDPVIQVGPESISCITATSCVAVTRLGAAYTSSS